MRHILTVTCPSHYMDEDPTLPFFMFSSSRKIDCPPAYSHLSFLLSAAHPFSCDFPTSQWFSGQVLSSSHVFFPQSWHFPATLPLCHSCSLLIRFHSFRPCSQVSTHFLFCFFLIFIFISFGCDVYLLLTTSQLTAC